jgi:predicted AlkP superfamily pyrophosphatase or phosphodiesterase
MRTMYKQGLETILSRNNPLFLSGKDIQGPVYDGFSIANIPASICGWLGCPLDNHHSLSPLISKNLENAYDQIILLLVDGLNLSLFNKFYTDAKSGNQPQEWEPLLSRGIFSPLTSIVPSTTSAALTTLWTGVLPIEHGIIGYELFLKEFGCIVNMITHSAASFIKEPANISGAGFNPKNFLPVPTLGTHFSNCNVAAHVYQHHSISDSGLSQMLFNDVTKHSFIESKDLWKSAARVLNQKSGQKKFLYIYWGDLDTRSHRSGPTHTSVRDEWDSFSQSIYQFLSAINSEKKRKTLFILTADHGQIPTEIIPEYTLANHKNLTNHLIMNPTGESRLPFLFIKNGREAEVEDYLKKHWEQKFKMLPSNIFLASGLMGSGAAYKGTIDRIGNYVVIPKENAYWWWVDKENVLYGRHGGLSTQEMLIPFFALQL